MTSIEWTDETWNPTRGCSRVSEGCRNCYAERIAARFAWDGYGDRPDLTKGTFDGFAMMTKSGPKWTGRVELVPEKLTEPLRWKKPRRVFVNSMSDLFHERLDDEHIREVFDVMAECPRHTFQVLTKRAQRMRAWVKAYRSETVLPNVWLGVSVEDQETANDRVWDLLFTPAAKRFVSYEPALEAVDFNDAPRSPESTAGPWSYLDDIDWVIVGGESGPGARTFNIAWALSMIEQCRATRTAVFVKQLGSKPVRLLGDPPRIPQRLKLKDSKGGDFMNWPAELKVREWPQAPYCANCEDRGCDACAAPEREL